MIMFPAASFQANCGPRVNSPSTTMMASGTRPGDPI